MANSGLVAYGTLTASQAAATTGTLGASVTTPVDGFLGATWIVSLTGTFNSSSTVHFSGSYDGGATYSDVTFTQVVGGSASSATTVGSSNAPQVFVADATGLSCLRVWCSAFQAGDAIAVRIEASNSSIGLSARPMSTAPQSGYKEVVATNVNSATPIAAIDAIAYNWVSIQVVANASADTLVWQGSNDNATWQGFTLQSTTATQAQGALNTSSATAGLTWAGALPFRYVQVIDTSGTTHAVSITMELKQWPGAYAAMGATAQLTPSSSGGNAATLTRVVSTNTSSTLTQLKAGSGILLGAVLSNTNAALRVLKIWNANSANVTVGTTAPNATVLLPANTTISLSLGTYGMGLGTGMTIAYTANAGDSDTTQIANGDIYGNFLWK